MLQPLEHPSRRRESVRLSCSSGEPHAVGAPASDADHAERVQMVRARGGRHPLAPHAYRGLRARDARPPGPTVSADSTRMSTARRPLGERAHSALALQTLGEHIEVW
jgi:hypothetical protein